jgi:hypothetical protein
MVPGRMTYPPNFNAMEPTTEEIINQLPKVEFKNKLENAIYYPELLNYKDVNELKTVITPLGVAFGDEMRRKDAVIEALTKRVEKAEERIEISLLPDYLKPANP